MSTLSLGGALVKGRSDKENLSILYVSHDQPALLELTTDLRACLTRSELPAKEPGK